MFFLPSEERSLNKLFAGDSLTTVIDQFVLLAIPTLAISVAGLSAQEVSILTSSQWIPALLLSGIFGAIVDSHDRRLVLGLAGVVAAAGAGAATLVSSIESSWRLYYLLAFGLMYAAGATLYSVGSAANVPRLAVSVSVPEAVSAQASIRNVARIVGLAFAGPAVQIFGAVASLVLASILSVVRAGIVATIPSAESDVSERQRARQDRTSAWKVTLSSNTLRRLLFANATMNAGSAMILGSFFTFCYSDLGIAPFSVGVMLFIGGCFAIAGSKQSTRLMARFSPRALCATAGIGASAAVWLIPASVYLPTLPTLFLYEALFSVAATLFAISFAVVRQRMVPSHLLGKLVAVSTTSGAAAMVGGSLVGAAVIAHSGVFAAICLGCALSSFGAVFLIGMTRTDESFEAPSVALHK